MGTALAGVVTPSNHLIGDGGRAIAAFARKAGIPFHAAPSPGKPTAERYRTPAHQYRQRLPQPSQAMADAFQRRRHQVPAQLSRMAPRPRSLGRSTGPTDLDQRPYRKRSLPTPNAIRGKHPVQLLYDARGIYGVGLVDRAVENDRCPPEDLILRPDRLLQAQTPGAAALQMIIGGFRHGMFSHMAEERLRQHIHWEMLRRRGLKWPPYVPKWWSEDSKQQARNRQIYHGLRLASLAVINTLIAEALQAAAEPNALALARRFPFLDRYKIYCATAPNHRAVPIDRCLPRF